MEKNEELTPKMKVEILYNNLMGVLKTFEFDDRPFARGMLCVIKPCLMILTTETLEELREEADKIAFAIMEPNN